MNRAPFSVGLCLECRHGRRVVAQRGSEFWLCRRAMQEPAFARYPRLPVLHCPGYEEARTP
jgi:hypothetical protein